MSHRLELVVLFVLMLFFFFFLNRCLSLRKTQVRPCSWDDRPLLPEEETKSLSLATCSHCLNNVTCYFSNYRPQRLCDPGSHTVYSRIYSSFTQRSEFAFTLVLTAIASDLVKHNDCLCYTVCTMIGQQFYGDWPLRPPLPILGCSHFLMSSFLKYLSK